MFSFLLSFCQNSFKTISSSLTANISLNVSEVTVLQFSNHLSDFIQIIYMVFAIKNYISGSTSYTESPS